MSTENIRGQSIRFVTEYSESGSNVLCFICSQFTCNHVSNRCMTTYVEYKILAKFLFFQVLFDPAHIIHEKRNTSIPVSNADGNSK